MRLINVNLHSILLAGTFIMHPRHQGMHIAIDSLLKILSFDMKFLCVDMFPYDDSEIVSVCLSVCLSVRAP